MVITKGRFSEISFDNLTESLFASHDISTLDYSSAFGLANQEILLNKHLFWVLTIGLLPASDSGRTYQIVHNRYGAPDVSQKRDVASAVARRKNG